MTKPTPTGHPEFDQWVQYREGQLSEQDEDTLQEHLSECPRCTGLLLDLEDFLSPPEAADDGTVDFERAAVWRSIRPSRRPTWHLPISIAASFLVGMLAVGAWTHGERQEVRQLEEVVASLTAPQPNTPIYHLVPTTRSSRPARQGFPLAQEIQSFTLVFNLASEDTESAYRAELINAAGEVALDVPDLELDEFGTLTLGLSRKSLEPGDYLVHVYNMTREDDAGEEYEDGEPKDEPEASYTFRLETI